MFQADHSAAPGSACNASAPPRKGAPAFLSNHSLQEWQPLRLPMACSETGPEFNVFVLTPGAAGP
ncbi:MAG: hypothetical protein IT210_26595 [Armatimonadetes bacterium]|nr:hypothetical protein [Armatimonadota bacterium]